jgi:hypothetical protein
MQYQLIRRLKIYLNTLAAMLISSFVAITTIPITSFDGVGGTGHDINEDSDLERSLLVEEKL